MTKRFFPFVLSRNDVAAAVASTRPHRNLAVGAGDGTSIEQQLADSFNANNAVMAYVLALTSSNLPAMTPEPDWYQSFVSQFSDAKTHALEWQNTVTPGLVAIPTGIINYAQIWSLNTTTISQAITFLQQDPQNAQARAALGQALSNLASGVGGQLGTATNFANVIEDFAAQLKADAQAMQQAIADAVQTQGYDEQKVQQLQDDIDALNDEIAKWQTVVTAAGIGAGVAFFAGAVIAIFSFGAGLAFGIIGAAAGIATLIAAEVKIHELAGKIAQDQLDMDNLNQQIAALKLLEGNLDTLISLSGKASEQVALIIEAWNELESELAAVVADLDQAESDLSDFDLVKLQSDIEQANTDWQALQAFCTIMAGIKYNQATPATVTLPTTTSAAA